MPTSTITGNLQWLLAATDLPAAGGDIVATAASPLLGLHRYPAVSVCLNCSNEPTGGTGPTLDVYLQASPDGGTTWQDVAHHQFTTSGGVRIVNLSQLVSGGTTTVAPSDGALSGDAVVQGPFGDRLRVKYAAAFGGGSGKYTLAVSCVPCGGG